MATDLSLPDWQHPRMRNHLRAWREAMHLTLEQVAEGMNTDKTQVSKLELGSRKLSTDWLERFAKFYGTVPTALMGPPASPTMTSRGYEAATVHQIEGETYARLPVYDIRAQAGKGALAYDGEPTGWRIFDLAFVKKVSRSPIEQLKVIEVAGDSMEPTLYKGDHVLIDLSNQAIAQPGLFVLRLDESLIVKRVQKLMRGERVRVMSDNPKYPPEEIDDPERLTVVGRVVWLGRSV